MKGENYNENRLETVGEGGPDQGRPYFRGGCAGVHRHRGGSPGGCELACGPERRRVRVRMRGAVGADGFAGS